MSNALSEPSFFSESFGALNTNMVYDVYWYELGRNIRGIGNHAMYVGQSSNENCTLKS